MAAAYVSLWRTSVWGRALFILTIAAGSEPLWMGHFGCRGPAQDQAQHCQINDAAFWKKNWQGFSLVSWCMSAGWDSGRLQRGVTVTDCWVCIQGSVDNNNSPVLAVGISTPKRLDIGMLNRTCLFTYAAWSRQNAEVLSWLVMGDL